MKKLKNQSGITLIALVVTIVVLLILAGVTITFVLSDTSVFTAARDARDDTMEAAMLEYAGQLSLRESIKYYTGEAGYTGETSEADPEVSIDSLAASFFPGYDSVDAAGLVSKSGKVKGTIKVTAGKKLYTITFDDTTGVPSVATSDAPAA